MPNLLQINRRVIYDNLIQKGTPIETYTIDGYPFFVKREDLACLPPGPPFAKVRGLFLYLQKLQANGCKVVGYMDTAISMAGWGISYFSKLLGMKAVLFYPKYKDGFRYNQSLQIKKWKEFEATILPLEKPTQHPININRAKKIFYSSYPKGVWLPNGLKFQETLLAVEKEATNTIKEVMPKTLIMCVGSGVMLSGVLHGIFKAQYKVPKIIGVLVHNGHKLRTKKREIFTFAHITEQGISFLDIPITKIVGQFNLVSGNYAYNEPCNMKVPFPCNPYYDLKAYGYLVEHIQTMQPPILFWNIGA